MAGVKYWLLRKQRGATATEYAVIIAIVALVILAAATGLGSNLVTFFQNVGNAVLAKSP